MFKDGLSNTFIVYTGVSNPQYGYFTSIVSNWVDINSKLFLEQQYAKAMQSLLYGTDSCKSYSERKKKEFLNSINFLFFIFKSTKYK